MPTRGHFSKVNTYRVLRTIQISNGISRKVIADKLGLDKSTLTKIVSSLMQTGIIVESPSEKPGPGAVGRRPILLDLNPQFGNIVGFEIDSDRVLGCIIDFHGNVLVKEHVSRTVTQKTIVGTIVKVFESLKSQFSTFSPAHTILGAGVSLPGIINPFDGIVSFSHPLAVRKPFELGSMLEEALGVPVILENNANCGCWGELFSRKERDDEDLVFVFIDDRKKEVPGMAPSGIAVGLGVAVDGRVRYGNNHLAGVFRSAFLTPGDKSQFHSKEREGELRELGANIAVIVNTLAPEHVILYGAMSDPSSIAIIKEEIAKRWPFPVDLPSDIITSRLPEPGLAYGAAAMFMETLFSMPRIPKVGEPVSAVYRGKELLSLY